MRFIRKGMFAMREIDISKLLIFASISGIVLLIVFTNLIYLN
jgi:hypothetical protein